MKFFDQVWLGKAINYEYWPSWVFYILVLPYIVYLGIKAKSCTFFTNVNPFIKDSGLKNYSKFKVMESIPEKLKPKGILIKANESSIHLPDGLTFPVIAKPDKGERGKGVKLIHTCQELNHYSSTLNKDFIVQEFIDYPFEAGIFFVRKPAEARGKITSFTTKEFLSVTGDGKNNIEKLMEENLRSRLQIKRLDSLFKSKIPAKNERVTIEVIGNHNKGTRFINSNHAITPLLEDSFNLIAGKINGFHYGRFDLKYRNFESLEKGSDIKIVELNGINSEPTHIYDQKTGIKNALKDLCYHWQLMYQISIENHRLGYKRSKAWPFLKSIFFQ